MIQQFISIFLCLSVAKMINSVAASWQLMIFNLFRYDLHQLHMALLWSRFILELSSSHTNNTSSSSKWAKKAKCGKTKASMPNDEMTNSNYIQWINNCESTKCVNHPVLSEGVCVATGSLWMANKKHWKRIRLRSYYVAVITLVRAKCQRNLDVCVRGKLEPKKNYKWKWNFNALYNSRHHDAIAGERPPKGAGTKEGNVENDEFRERRKKSRGENTL